MSGPLCCSGVGGIGCGEAQVSDRSAVCRALTREDFSTGSLPMNCRSGENIGDGD